MILKETFIKNILFYIFRILISEPQCLLTKNFETKKQEKTKNKKYAAMKTKEIILAMLTKTTCKHL